MLKGVTFDLWFTLLPSNGELDKAWERVRLRQTRRILAEHGFEIDTSELKDKIKTFDEQIHQERKRNGIDYSTDVHIAKLTEFLIPSAQDNQRLHQQLKETYVRPVLEDRKVSLGKGVPDMLITLKASGWKVGLISNTGKTPGTTFRDLFAKWGILDYFDTLVFSDEVGYYKPNQHIFHAAEVGLGLQHFELVHVGDMISADVCGALGAGWQAIHFRQYLPLRYLDENEQDARCLAKCPSQAVAETYDDVVKTLNALQERSMMK